MTSQPQRLHVILMLAASLALGFALLIYILYSINLIQFPFDYDQGEGFEVHDSVLFSRGELPYRDIESYPFYSSNYPPLFHLMAAPFVWFFGPGYWYGRLLGFLGSLLTAGAIAWTVHHEGRHRWIALLAGLAFLSSNMVYHIGPLFRQHMTMVMFETLAVAALARAWPRRQTKGIALGLLLLICAGYTKQLAAITALAAVGWMFLRRPRRAIGWAAGFMAAGAAIFWALNIASDGQWWLQVVVANINEFQPRQAFGLFDLWFKLHGFLLLPAGLLLVYETYFARLSIYSVWFVLTALLGGIAAGTWGAGDSYFTTSIAAMCILSGICLSRILSHRGDFRPKFMARALPGRRIVSLGLVIVPILYLGYARATLKMPTAGAFAALAQALNIEANVNNGFFDSATFNVGGYARIGYFLTPQDTQAGHQIADLIRQSDRPVLSEEAGFSMVAGREVIANPTQLRNLYLAGLYEGRQLIEMIEEQQFGLVILRAQFYPLPVLVAIGQFYRTEAVIRMNGFDYSILYPKEPAP